MLESTSRQAAHKNKPNNRNAARRKLGPAKVRSKSSKSNGYQPNRTVDGYVRDDSIPPERVSFERFKRQPFWLQALGVPLIYIPVLLLPFVVLAGVLTYWHLKLVGADGVKPYGDFLPEKQSHRYDRSNQVVLNNKIPFMNSKLYWVFNCSVYCPYSVALFRWIGYMVMIVENWWCPFYHSRKPEYAAGSIDQSFWHAYRDSSKHLHPEDRANPIWNAKQD